MRATHTRTGAIRPQTVVELPEPTPAKGGAVPAGATLVLHPARYERGEGAEGTKPISYLVIIGASAYILPADTLERVLLGERQ